mmetsp:Transcript_32930/g.86515  ORF Transcript_32930/g.86515 Transcript_32930/m.86515 type:complete len:142 (-) Transcript_32930:235-660(-)
MLQVEYEHRVHLQTQVMEKLAVAPDEVELSVLRFVIMRKPREVQKAPTLTIDGKAGEVQKGVIMRTAIQKTGAEIHKGLKAKLNQCGGVGQCSTCWVNVVDGMENLSERTDVEVKKGAKRPDTYRMSCQSLVNGDVTVQIP